jgi:aspartyl-tRNA(Asn)/glutamyl-tRNA(Gln) amidotransferase subunit A
MEPIARSAADSALLLQVIAGYDPHDVGSRQMPIPDYSAALLGKVSSFRVGIALTFFFDDLDPEIEAAANGALGVLERITGSVRDVTTPASTQEAFRAAVRAAEACAYQAELIEKSPDLYQPETLALLRAGADVKTPAYILARREVELTRRTGIRFGQHHRNTDDSRSTCDASWPWRRRECAEDRERLSIRNT